MHSTTGCCSSCSSWSNTLRQYACATHACAGYACAALLHVPKKSSVLRAQHSIQQLADGPAHRARCHHQATHEPGAVIANGKAITAGKTKGSAECSKQARLLHDVPELRSGTSRGRKQEGLLQHCWKDAALAGSSGQGQGVQPHQREAQTGLLPRGHRAP